MAKTSVILKIVNAIDCKGRSRRAQAVLSDGKTGRGKEDCMEGQSRFTVTKMKTGGKKYESSV